MHDSPLENEPIAAIEQCVNAWCIAAHSVLSTSGILHTLEVVGTPTLVGSYSSRLLLSPDIDIHVDTEQPSREAALTFFTAIAQQNFFEGITLFDWERHTPPKHHAYPKASYIGMSLHVCGVKWKIDCWFLTHKQMLDQQPAWLMDGLHDPQCRENILVLKAARACGRFNAPSMLIYEAVILHHVSNVRDFLLYLDTKVAGANSTPASISELYPHGRR